MTSFSASQLQFSVARCEPVMIVPAQPTPYEVKTLSDIDDQRGLRVHFHLISFYQKVVGMEGRDPAKVVREAIARALVYYYPFAGRLRDGLNGKLMVECTGEGVMFVEADASVRLEQFGDVIQPPFPCVNEFIYNVPGSDGIINSPLLLIQVTRLMCGGFVFSLRLNHVMCDASGLSQFLKAVSEMVPAGARVPSVKPVWERELLLARDPPQVSCVHQIYHDLSRGKETPQAEDQINFPPVIRSFFFGPQEMKALRNQLALHLRKCSRFELLTACLWRCRTISLGLDLDEEVRLAFTVNLRTKCNPQLPVGFYGNTSGVIVAVSTVDKICHNPLGYTLELVMNAKAKVTDEHLRSLADFLVKMGRPLYFIEQTYTVSDLTHLGLNDINFGWGKPLYAGVTGEFPPATSMTVPSKNNKGEDGTLVPLRLAAHSMEIFVRELGKMIEGSSFISSPL